MHNPKEKEFTVPVTMQLPEKTYNLIKLMAFQSNMAISRYCRTILEKFLTESASENTNQTNNN